MAGLMGSMSIALSSLKNNQEALDVTSNNIANQNTPGYSRQRVNFSESSSLDYGTLQFGTGSQIDNIQSIRDQVLEFRINSESQQEAALDAYLGPMQQVQASFNEAAGTGLQTSISGFFNSLTQLSTDPNSVPLRQGVITAAQNMTAAFNSAANNLSQLQTSTNAQIPTVAQQINTLASSIAQLNTRISQSQSSGNNSGTLEDERNQLISKMSQLVNISMVQGDHGVINISTAMGAALVVGGQNFDLKISTSPSTGMNQIQASDGTDITSGIDGGQLGGLLRVRDQAIPGLSSKLDTLAASIANSVNAVHTAGFDLNGNAGQKLFTVPATVAGSAQFIQLNITDPTKIAASQSGASGDNANALAIAQLQNQNIASGQTPLDYYSSTVAQLGTDVQLATSQRDTQDVVVQQLQTQRNSISGVSLDEEAANLIQFQRAYQAAARVVNVVDELTQTAINLGVGGT
ncbi:MAG TPA: flagellar hook-associated protein FlgK [Candidatus Angelobacter sp.]|nr:flagellar hook-associated protein FlgK [Candidatus Angelobacter sp.]